MKKKANILLFMLSIFVGSTIVIQSRSRLDIGVVGTVKSIESLEGQIESLNKELDELEKIEEEASEKLEILKDLFNSDDKIEDLLEKELTKNKIAVGALAVTGPGISVTMYDNTDKRGLGYNLNDDVIHDIDILNVVNDLKIAGAEAISINGERYISMSGVKCRGPAITINNRSSTTPFVIKAIGDPKALRVAVSSPGSYGDIMKNVYQKGFDIKVYDDIYIPEYKGLVSFKYAKPLEEGD